MTVYSTQAQRFGLAKESVRGTAEAAPTKWYPTRGIPEFTFGPQLLEDKGIRGVAAKYAPIVGVNVGTGKLPLYFDPQMLGECFYSLLGAVASAEDSTITISASNKYIDFTIGAGALAAQVAVASYPIGTSSSQSGTLCEAIKNALFAADATGTYTVTYSRTTKLFTLTRSTGTFTIKFATGTNLANSIATTIGFPATDVSASLSYTGSTQIEYAFTHTFTQSGILPLAYTFFQDRSLNVLKYNRGCVKSIALKGGVDNLVEVDVDVLFENEASGSIGSPSFPTQRFQSFQHAQFKIAGSTDTTVKEWDLKIDNGARAHRTLNASQNLSDIVAPEPIMIDGSFTAYFANTTERAKFLANTAVAIRVLSQGATIAGSSKWAHDINVYEAHYKGYPYTDDQGLLAAKATFEGFYSTSDSKAVQVALTNQDASY